MLLQKLGAQYLYAVENLEDQCQNKKKATANKQKNK